MEPLSSLMSQTLATAKDSFSVPSLRDHIALWKDRAQLLEREVAHLKQESETLREEVALLKQSAHQMKQESIFEDFGVCLAKRDASGKFHQALFCLRCKTPLHQDRARKGTPFVCSKCHSVIDYHEGATIYQRLAADQTPS